MLVWIFPPPCPINQLNELKIHRIICFGVTIKSSQYFLAFLEKEEEKELKPNQENLMDHHIEKIKHEFYTYIYRTTMKNH